MGEPLLSTWVPRELIRRLHVRNEAKLDRTLCGRLSGTVVGRFHGQSERMRLLVCGSCARVANTAQQRLLHGQNDRILTTVRGSAERINS